MISDNSQSRVLKATNDISKKNSSYLWLRKTLQLPHKVMRPSHPGLDHPLKNLRTSKRFIRMLPLITRRGNLLKTWSIAPILHLMSSFHPLAERNPSNQRLPMRTLRLRTGWWSESQTPWLSKASSSNLPLRHQPRSPLKRRQPLRAHLPPRFYGAPKKKRTVIKQAR